MSSINIVIKIIFSFILAFGPYSAHAVSPSDLISGAAAAYVIAETCDRQNITAHWQKIEANYLSALRQRGLSAPPDAGDEFQRKVIAFRQSSRAGSGLYCSERDQLWVIAANWGQAAFLRRN